MKQKKNIILKIKNNSSSSIHQNGKKKYIKNRKSNE